MIQFFPFTSKFDSWNFTFAPAGSVWTLAQIFAELSVWFALVFIYTSERSFAERNLIEVPGKFRLSFMYTFAMSPCMDKLSYVPVALSFTSWNARFL